MTDEIIKRDTVEYNDPTPFDNTRLHSTDDIMRAIRHKMNGKDVREPMAQLGEALIKLIQATSGNQLAEITAARGNFELLGIRLTAQDNAISNIKNYATNYLAQMSVTPETVADAAQLATKYPTGKNGLFITADTGHKYIWNGTQWFDAGVYQAVGIAPNSVATEALKQSAVTLNKIDGLTVNSRHSVNRFDSKNYSIGAITESDDVFTIDSWVHTNFIAVPTGAVVRINQAYQTYLCTYDKFGNFLKAYENSNVESVEVQVDDNARFIIVNCFTDYIDSFMLTINTPMPASYQPFINTIDDAEINWLNFRDNSISPAKINGTKIIKRRSINRYNEQDVIPNQAATLDGIVTFVNWQRTDYLNVNPGDVITVSHAFETIAVAYNQAKEPVKSWEYKGSEQGQTTFIIPENAFFVIINVMKDWPNFMFSVNEPLPDTYEPFVKNDIVDVSWISRSKFENKSATMFGDSITWYDSHAQPDGTIAAGYESWLENILGFTTVQNLGISGAPFATGKTPDNGIGAKIESEYKTTDLVLIAGGTNDFKFDVPLGEIQPISGTFDKTTTSGALQSALEHILTTDNDQEILLMTPIQRDNSGYSIYSVNQAGYKLDDYRQMIIKLGALYSIPVWDGYAASGLNLLNLDKYTLDGLHPNNSGFERISKSLAAYIKGVF